MIRFLGKIEFLKLFDKKSSHLKDAVKAVGPNGKVIHIAHSQGALITSLALRGLTKKEMSQMEIISFGGAAALRRSREHPFVRCVNYYSVNDPLLFVVPSAVKALQSGFLQGSTSTGDEDDVEVGEESEFVFLTPRSGDPIEDHGLLGPTYIEALIWEGKRYQQYYIPIVERTLRTALITFHQSFVMNEVLKPILRRTLIPLVLFVQKVNAYVQQYCYIIARWMYQYLFSPILVLLLVCWELLESSFRILFFPSSRNDQFDLIDKELLKLSEDEETKEIEEKKKI